MVTAIEQQVIDLQSETRNLQMLISQLTRENVFLKQTMGFSEHAL
jgi:hypothetical protein